MKRAARRRLGFFLVFTAPALWWGGLVLASLTIMIAISFYTRRFPTQVPDFQFGNYTEIFENFQYVSVLLRTVKIAVLVCIFDFLIGFPLAYFIAFKVRSKQMRMVFYMATIIPVWVSYLLRAYTWKTILGTQGVLNSFLMWLGITDEPVSIFLYNQYAMIITIGYICLPLMILPLYASLEKIPRNLIEASKDLGAGSVGTFLHVTFPLSVPGIIAGGTLAFCLAVGDFVSPILVGGPSSNMIANVLLTQFGMSLNWPLGAAISVVMLIAFVVLLSFSNQAERHGRMDLA